MRFTYAKGVTSYMEGDTGNLIPQHITLQSELNEWEQANILEAEQWIFGRSNKPTMLASEFVQKVHYKMFDKTWRWAGQFRKHQTNIGCHAFEIATKLKQLLSDIDYYINNQTYDLIEIAVRLHHGLVYIHCFPNGNGRHARIMADLLLAHYQCKRLSWGSGNIWQAGDLRKNYISALKEADNHDFTKLILFAKGATTE